MKPAFSTNQLQFRSPTNSDASNELEYVPRENNEKDISIDSNKRRSIRRQKTTDSGVVMNPNRIEKESPYVSVNFARQLSANVCIKPLKEDTLTRGKFDLNYTINQSF